MTQTVYFYFDDSGVLHKNEKSGYFVYAGFVFCSEDERNEAKYKYIAANKKLRESLGIEGELKACKLKQKHKRSLYNSVRYYETVSAAVKIDRVYDYIMDSKKARCRYKDYVIKRCIKSKLKEMVNRGIINNFTDTDIHVFIDEQLTATDGYYDLRDSIREELQHGVANWDYGVQHKNLFNAEVNVTIEYCNSEKNYMIQAADILANRVWCAYWRKDGKLLKIPNHLLLTFP